MHLVCESLSNYSPSIPPGHSLRHFPSNITDFKGKKSLVKDFSNKGKTLLVSITHFRAVVYKVVGQRK